MNAFLKHQFDPDKTLEQRRRDRAILWRVYALTFLLAFFA
jgi:hypothetical protein